jgi:hypothetical protein
MPYKPASYREAGLQPHAFVLRSLMLPATKRSKLLLGFYLLVVLTIARIVQLLQEIYEDV